MTDNTDDRPRSRWVTVHEHEITVDPDGIPDGIRVTTAQEVLTEIDWPAAIQRQQERRDR